MKKFLLPVMVVVALAFASCSKDAALEGDKNNNGGDSTGTENPAVGVDSVVTFTNVKIGLAPGDQTYGRVFSSVTGLVYLDDAIPDSVGKYINLAFHYQASFSMFFSSADPNAFDITIPGVTKTNVRNYVDSSFKVTSFDTLTHASTLKKLTVTNDNETIDAADLPLAVFFKNSDGKIGIIKVKSLFDNYVLVDVKVEYK
ncbi:hypothetical protein SAMN05518672_103233 [Chitinophaga sp. CF118]|uniref:hypothetical protein n=1 Tax=Chitinophaga sp. CF118 TaxID=1884367 RepID=UPI0008E16002|nr:hypothetical protein [Chitinophaga sp. CF118]SFD79182.1 hypothetical protein SAMN05518672_103233 [Chitinophaga sp. CF118]